MARVKASKRHRYVAVKHRPVRVWAARFLVLILLVASGGSGYWYGSQQTIAKADRLNMSLSEKDRELLRLQESEEQARQQLMNIKMAGEVDRKASEEVRQEVLDLRSQIASLEEENGFYRNLMAAEDKKSELSFGDVTIDSTDNADVFEYEIVVQQIAKSHNVVNGSLTVRVVGKQGNIAETLNLTNLSSAAEGDQVKLRFRYFQRITGEWAVPAGFVPQYIDLQARFSGKKPVTINKQIDWIVQQRD